MIQNRRNWTDYEDRAIVSLVRKHGLKNWAQISTKISSKYGIQHRTGKQCRERWYNHLDPDVNKDPWTQKDENIMFEAHQKYGNKWTQLAKLFDGRTDNDIKNHFYSMLRRSLRKINKLLGNRNSTERVRQIKPSVLSKIFSNNGKQGDKQFQIERKKIAEDLFLFSKPKIQKDLSRSMDYQQRKRLQNLIKKLSLYNQQYEISQIIKKQSKKSQIEEVQQIKLQPIQAEFQQIIVKPTKTHSFPTISSPDQRKNQKISIKKQQNDSSQKIKIEDKLDDKIIKNRKKDKVKRKKDCQKILSKGVKLPENTQQMQKQQSNLNIDEQFNFEPNQDNYQHLPFPIFRLKSLSNTSESKFSMQKNQKISLNPTPSMNIPNFAQTPQWPTPNVGMFKKESIQWVNNEQLDNIISIIGRTISRRASK